MSSKESVALTSDDSGEYESQQSTPATSLPLRPGSSTSSEASLYTYGPTEESVNRPPQSIEKTLSTDIQPSAGNLYATDSTQVNVSETPYTATSLQSRPGSSISSEASLYKCGPTEVSAHCPPQSIERPLSPDIQQSANNLYATNSTQVNVSETPYTATSLQSRPGSSTSSEASLYKCGPTEVSAHCPPHSQTTLPSDSREYFSELEFEEGNISTIRLGTFSEILTIPYNTVDDNTEIRKHCMYQVKKIADYLNVEMNDRTIFLNYDEYKTKSQGNKLGKRLCAYYLLLESLVEGNRYSDNSKMISNKKVLFYLKYLANELKIVFLVERYHNNYDNTLPNTILRMSAFGYAEPLRMYYYKKHEKEIIEYAQNFQPICFVQELDYNYEYIPSLSGSMSLKQIFLFVDGIPKKMKMSYINTTAGTTNVFPHK